MVLNLVWESEWSDKIGDKWLKWVRMIFSVLNYLQAYMNWYQSFSHDTISNMCFESFTSTSEAVPSIWEHCYFSVFFPAIFAKDLKIFQE